MGVRANAISPAPIDIEFRPEGGSNEYAIDGDYDWNPVVAGSMPFSFASFTHSRAASNQPWQAMATPVTGLSPFGRWRIRIKNGGNTLNNQPIAPAAYPGLFSNDPPVYGQRKLVLDAFADALLMLAYSAKISYRFASV